MIRLPHNAPKLTFERQVSRPYQWEHIEDLRIEFLVRKSCILPAWARAIALRTIVQSVERLASWWHFLVRSIVPVKTWYVYYSSFLNWVFLFVADRTANCGYSMLFVCLLANFLESSNSPDAPKFVQNHRQSKK